MTIRSPITQVAGNDAPQAYLDADDLQQLRALAKAITALDKQPQLIHFSPEACDLLYRTLPALVARSDNDGPSRLIVKRPATIRVGDKLFFHINDVERAVGAAGGRMEA